MFTQDDRLWNMSLIVEANSARSLFAHGLHVVDGMPTDVEDAVVAMSLLALGAEKLLKLTIGLAWLDNGAGWPDQKYMRNKVGHRTQHGDKEARKLVDLGRGAASGHVADLAAAVDADPVLAAILATLDRFGDAGRFYFLDALGDQPQQQSAPQVLWQQMTSDIAASVPGLLRKLNSMEVVEGRRELNAILVRSLTGWWDFYRAVWATGAIGDRAKRFAPEIRLQQH